MNHGNHSRSSDTSGQLVLPMSPRQEARFDNFFGETNRKAVALLKESLDKDGDAFIFVCGPPDSGKTHLANAAVMHAESLGMVVYYLALSEVVNSDMAISEIFSGLPDVDFICLDGLDEWLTSESRELDLFNLFNHSKMSGIKLLVTGRTAPGGLSLELPDLRSRLLSGLVIALQPLDDHEKQLVLKAMAHERGIELTDEVSGFVIKRSRRNLGQLIAVLEELDRASLVQKRKLTVPFVKQVLRW